MIKAGILKKHPLLTGLFSKGKIYQVGKELEEIADFPKGWEVVSELDVLNLVCCLAFNQPVKESLRLISESTYDTITLIDFLRINLWSRNDDLTVLDFYNNGQCFIYTKNADPSFFGISDTPFTKLVSVNWKLLKILAEQVTDSYLKRSTEIKNEFNDKILTYAEF